jgi:ribose transport system permease protein
VTPCGEPLGDRADVSTEEPATPGTQLADADAVERPRKPRRRLLDLLYNYSVLWALLAEIVVFSILAPNSFFTVSNAQSIIGSQAVLLIVALGLTIPLAVNEFDLSIAAMVGFAEVILAVLAVQQHWPLALAVIATLIICGLIGLVNAFLVVWLGIGAFIATLATSTLLYGVSIAITNDEPLVGIPNALINIASTKFLGIELVFWYGLAATVILWYVLTKTPIGRWLYFTGANREAARLNGIAVGRMRGGALVASAMFAGLAGILYSGVFATADPTTAQDQFLLPAFAAAFLGATAVTPGRFNALGTFIAVYLVITGIVGLSLVTNQVGWVAEVFNGGILILAVASQRLVIMRRNHARAAS